MPFDKQYIIELIKTNTKDTFDFIDALSNEQIEIKPFDKWSVLDNLEHIFLTEKLIYLMLCRPSDLKSEKIFELGENQLKQKIVDERQNKLNAPESLKPKGKITTISDFKEKYSDLREQLITDILNLKMLIDKRVYKHLYLGEMTVADWLIFIVNHNKRHLFQIKDLIKKLP